ncbi:30S ribosomal protein S19e [Candidatus Woesearchaeota archaeon]|nr:30S ribosomal protein S19e [Candidatus Woesearchaeota archaeon]
MATIFDIDSQKLIEKASEELKKVQAIQPPEWAIFVKTGMHKERPPINPDWWYVRAASVLRKIYLRGPIGVSKLRTLYGGKKNRGHKPEHFYKGSGNIIRKILQQLTKAGFVKEEKKGLHKGRVMTKEGKAFLNKISIMIGGKAAEEKPAEAHKEKITEQPTEADKTGKS